MPVEYDLPRSNTTWRSVDQDKYNKLPYYFAYLGARMFPHWKTWSKMYGSLPWTPNQGTTLRGVMDEPTPLGRQEFVPNLITSLPKKDILEVEEATVDARIRRHNFESKVISFLGSFQDFKNNKIPMHMKNIVRQMAIASDHFIRSFIFHHCATVIVPDAGIDGNSEGEIKTSVPVHTDPSTDYTTAKDQDFRAWAISELGADGKLTYRKMKKYAAFFKDDVFAEPFEGAWGAEPKTNEMMKGKFLYVGESRTWEAVAEDDTVLSRKTDSLDLLTSEFSGSIGGMTLFKAERYPLRMLADGSFPAPELMVEEGALDNRTRVNPAYMTAPYTITFLCAGNAFKSINIGPPPSEFSKKQISADKFSALRWNGEVRLTDNILVNYGSGVYDTNKYGEHVQLFADAVFGAIPINPDYVIAIIHKRSDIGN